MAAANGERYAQLGKGDPPLASARRNGLLTGGASVQDEPASSSSSSIGARLWTSVFGSRQVSAKLPSYNNAKRDTLLRTPGAPARSLYDNPPPTGRRVSLASLGPIGLLRALILRPFYVLGRRGPLLPMFLIFVLAFYVFAYSTSPSTQSVKRRVQGAVGPYVPRRAAEAIKWGSERQKTWSLKDALRFRNEEAKDARKGAKKTGKKELASLPEARRDGRLVIEAGKPHPIPALMKRAKLRWEQLKARQSQNFREAVQEYERRHRRKPPKGFDQW